MRLQVEREIISVLYHLCHFKQQPKQKNKITDIINPDPNKNIILIHLYTKTLFTLYLYHYMR